MSNNRILNFSVLKEEITQDNVLQISESVAFLETRFLIGYIGKRMQKIYANLYSDIKNKHNINHIFSDGYDLVQEGVLFLCEHYGKHLSDVIGITNKGKKITVQIACTKRMMKLINRKMSDNYRCMCVENASEVCCDLWVNIFYHDSKNSIAINAITLCPQITIYLMGFRYSVENQHNVNA